MKQYNRQLLATVLKDSKKPNTNTFPYIGLHTRMHTYNQHKVKSLKDYTHTILYGKEEQN